MRLTNFLIPRATNMRTVKIGLSFEKQAATLTALTAAEMWGITKLNEAMTRCVLNSEDDALELGKGHEFAANNYPTSWDVSGGLEKYNSSQWLAWAFAFTLGKVVVTSPASGAYQYVCTMMDDTADGIEQPLFTLVEKISGLDRAYVGCMVQDLSFMVGSGPGRANSKCSVNYVGTGKFISPSTVTIPATLTENLLGTGGAQITVIGEDYVTAKKFVSMELSIATAPRTDEGYYPGSGTQDSADAASGAIRGRMERGDRTVSLKYRARFESDSVELTKMKNQTEGTLQLVLTGGIITGSVRHKITLLFHRVRFRTVEVGSANGLTTVDVDCVPMFHATNGLMTATIITDQELICSAEV